MKSLTIFFAFLTSFSCTSAFLIPSLVSQHRVKTSRLSLTPLSAKKNKGFSKKSKATSTAAPTPQASTTKTETEPTTSIPAVAIEQKNLGQQALDKLRDEATQKQVNEVEKIREIRSVDEFIRDDPTAAVIPEKVAMRMGKRMLPFVGIPLFGSMGAFVAFWYYATYKNVQFETGLVAITTIAFLVIGLVGITYSVMSASWDPDREGTGLGFGEFSNNFDSIKDGLKRSRENLVVRDQMAGMAEEDIQRAIKELDKRDEKAKLKSMTLQEKLDR